jgi:hypothetical protein
MKKNRTVRLSFSVILLLAGALLVVVVPRGQTGQAAQLEQLVQGLGLSMIVTAIISIYRELAILHTESEDAADDIARRLREQQAEPPPFAGLRLAATARRNYDGYYRWEASEGSRDLFAAGRSVLHRMHPAYGGRHGPPEETLARKLHDGWVIHIMFLDPTSDLIERLARQEHERPEQMYADLATSVGVCHRLHELVHGKALPSGARINIRLYDEVPFFAYQRDRSQLDRDDELVLIGFYLTSELGSTSPAFEAVDADSRRWFEAHLMSVFNRASGRAIIDLDVDRNMRFFNHALLDQLGSHFTAKLGEDEWLRRLRGEDIGPWS